MHGRIRSAVLGGLTLAFCFSLSPVWGQQASSVEQAKKARVKQVQKPVSASARVALPPCEGPDLSASLPTITKSVAANKGILSITATIKNAGKKDFVSGPNQAAGNIVVHKEGVSGPAAYNTVSNVPIARLNVGQSVNLSGTHEIPVFIEWGERTPRSGECKAQVDVTSRINWDPDIRMDSNPQNDDCRASNDQTAPVVVKYMVQCPW